MKRFKAVRITAIRLIAGITKNVVIYPKTALRCLATLDVLRHYHALLMTRETRVMASFAAELSQQVALVLPPLQDNNSKLHMYNCNVYISLLTEAEPKLQEFTKSKAPPADPNVVSQVLIISLVVILSRLITAKSKWHIIYYSTNNSTMNESWNEQC